MFQRIQANENVFKRQRKKEIEGDKMSIATKPQTCSNCSLATLGKGFTQIEGIGSLPLMLVGESSGYNEALESLPFRPSAQAGSCLQRAINMTKFNRSQFSITNLVRCHPPQDKLLGQSYEYSAINKCRQYLDKAVEQRKPKVILALGALAFKHLVGLEGKGLGIQQCRGFVFRSSAYPEVLVVPTLHPAFVRRGNMKYLQLLLRDLHKATLIAQEKLKEGIDFILDPLTENYSQIVDDLPTRIRYNTSPSLGDAESLLATIQHYPNLLITYDIETEKSAGESEDELEEYGSRITQVQFSIGVGSGIALPFNDAFVPIIRQVLESANPKAGHNIWRFDNPILRRSGFSINGRLDDTMWMFHHFKADLPAGLQPVAQYFNFPFAWKHMAQANLPFYGIADVDSVIRIMQKLPDELKKRNLYGKYDKENEIYTGYEGLVYAINPILERISARGIPINVEKQQEFSIEIDNEKLRIEKELEPLIPDELLKVLPKEGYVREPKEIQAAESLYESYLSDGIRQGERADFILRRTGLSQHKFKVAPPKPRKTKKSQEISMLTFAEQLSELDKDNLIEVNRWCKILPFNPNSPDQISNYIKHIGDEARAKKAITKISREKSSSSEDHFNNNGNNSRAKKDNVKTSAEVLKRLYVETGNIVYKHILEYKGLTKMQGAFIEGWKPSLEDQKVHGEFTFRPATLQLSARNPNIQQSPTHSALAIKFQRTLEASPGYTFIKADMKSFHATMVGWLARDLDYIRLCRLDIHSYVAANILKVCPVDLLSQLDFEIKPFLSKIKKENDYIRNQAKRVILGIPYGLSENGCYERFRDDFNPTADQVNSIKRKKLEGDRLQKEVIRQGKKAVQSLYALLKKLFPKVFKWQQEILQLAHKQGFLQSPFGARREFSCVMDFKYTSSGKEILEMKKGEDAEKAASMLPQVNSFGHMRGSMNLLRDQGLDERYGLINTVHDDFWFLCKDELVLEATMEIERIMTRRSNILIPEAGDDKEFEPFWCDVEFKIGKNFAPFNETENPEGMKGI